MTFGAGKRSPTPCSFSYTVQVKPCTASFTITALTLEKTVDGREGGERKGRERERERERGGRGERERGREGEGGGRGDMEGGHGGREGEREEKEIRKWREHTSILN